MHIAHKVLLSLGATQVFNVDGKTNDPQTEEEFNNLQYESPIVITWDSYQEKYSVIEQKTGIRFLRAYRNELLKDTDWIMTVDNFESLANKNEWIAYRKALRDLPNNPPPFKWKGLSLDFEAMSLPIKPSIVRIPTDNVIE